MNSLPCRSIPSQTSVECIYFFYIPLNIFISFYFSTFQVKIEIFDDGDEVAEFEFDADLRNATSFFSPLNLRRSSYDDIPIGTPFNGDGFSFDGLVF